MRLPRIKIEWYKPGGIHKSEEEQEYEIDFAKNSEFAIIKASAINRAYMHRKEVFNWCDDSITSDTSENFSIDTKHFMVVDEQWEGYEKMAELWNKAAEQLDWSEE